MTVLPFSPLQTNHKQIKTVKAVILKRGKNEWFVSMEGIGEWERMFEWRKRGKVFVFIRRGQDFQG